MEITNYLVNNAKELMILHTSMVTPPPRLFNLRLAAPYLSHSMTGYVYCLVRMVRNSPVSFLKDGWKESLRNSI